MTSDQMSEYEGYQLTIKIEPEGYHIIDNGWTHCDGQTHLLLEGVLGANDDIVMADDIDIKEEVVMSENEGPSVIVIPDTPWYQVRLPAQWLAISRVWCKNSVTCYIKR